MSFIVTEMTHSHPKRKTLWWVLFFLRKTLLVFAICFYVRFSLLGEFWCLWRLIMGRLKWMLLSWNCRTIGRCLLFLEKKKNNISWIEAFIITVASGSSVHRKKNSNFYECFKDHNCLLKYIQQLQWIVRIVRIVLSSPYIVPWGEAGPYEVAQKWGCITKPFHDFALLHMEMSTAGQNSLCSVKSNLQSLGQIFLFARTKKEQRKKTRGTEQEQW